MRHRLLLAGHALAAIFLMIVLIFPQLYATNQFSSLAASRGDRSEWEYLTADSLPPHMMLSYIAPEFFNAGNNEGLYWGSRAGFHEVNAYIGAGALVLVLYALLTLFSRLSSNSSMPLNRAETRWLISLMALALIGFILALGRHTLIYKLAFNIVPGFSLFRVPARWILWMYAPACMFAAWGFHLLGMHLAQENPVRRQHALKFWLATSAVWLLAVAIMRILVQPLMNAGGYRNYNFFRDTEFHAEMVGQAGGALMWALSMMALIALVGSAALLRRLAPRMALGIIVGVLVIDLLRFWHPYRAYYPIETPPFVIASEAPFHRIKASEFTNRFFPETETVEALHDIEGRIFFTDDLLLPDFDQFTREFYAERPAYFEFESMRGYQPLQLHQYVDEFSDIARRNPGDKIPGSAFLLADTVIRKWPLDAYNVSHMLTYLSTVGPADNLQSFTSLGFEPYERITHVPGLQLDILRNTTAPGWAWLSSNSAWPGLEEKVEEVELQEIVRSPDTTTFNIVAPRDELYLHFAEVEYPGWEITAKPAGAAETIFSAGRTIKLPTGGEWHITRQFGFPTPTRIGIPISAITALVLLASLFSDHLNRLKRRFVPDKPVDNPEL